MDNLTSLDASELAKQLREGNLSAVDVVEAHIQRIETARTAVRLARFMAYL